MSPSRVGADGMRIGLAVWWRAVRPFSFTASATPVLVGASAALYDGRLHFALFLVTLVASVAIHAATNLTNDYYDHVHGVDTPTSIGPSGVIQQGVLAPRTVLRGSVALFAVGGVLGLLLVWIRGWPILVIGLLSILAGYAYTGGPFPLGYLGLGDAVVFLFMGPVIVLGTYFVQVGGLSSTALWAALPMGALVTAILVVNNLRDLDGDRAHGKRTFATVLGPDGTKVEYLLLLTVAYVALALGVGRRTLPPLVLVAVFTLPQAARVWRVVSNETDPVALTRGGVRGTAQLHAQFGLLITAALVLAA